MIPSRFSLSVIASIVGFCLLSTSSTVWAGPLQAASQFNVFVLDDLSFTNGSIGGRVAVGGDGRLTNFAIGSGGGAGLSADASRLDLIVGGAATLTYGSLQKGSAVAGSARQTGIGYNTAGASLTTGASPIDFADAGADLREESTRLAALTANGSVSRAWSTLTMMGTDAALNVFNLSAADVANISSLQLFAPSTSTVLINIVGPSFSLANLGIAVNGSQNGAMASQILWNFGGSSLSLGGLQWTGSILAPFAALQFSNGQMNGSVFVDSLIASGQFNNIGFGGTLPEPTQVPVPEPSTLALLALGTGALGVGRRWRRRLPSA